MLQRASTWSASSWPSGFATRHPLQPELQSDITLDLLAKRRNREADFIFVGQVNSELPFMPGEATSTPVHST